MHQSIIFDSIKKVLDKHKKSDHEGIRWLTTIDTKEDLKVAKRSLDLGMKIRHIENIPISILLTDKDFNLIADKIGRASCRERVYRAV
jgi:hypothetical protein